MRKAITSIDEVAELRPATVGGFPPAKCAADADAADAAEKEGDDE